MDNEADKPGSNSILGQGAFKQVLRARWKALVVQERLSIAFAVVGSVVILLAGTGGFASEEVRAAGPSQSIPGIIGGVALVLLAGGSYFQPWRRGASRDLLRCERKLRAREAEQNIRIDQAELKVKNLESPFGAQVANFAGVKLFERGISYGTMASSISADTRATVDAAGSISTALASRATLTRMAIGGMVLGPAGILAGGMFKKHSARAVDARELYLLVETNELAFSAPVAADKGVQARSFAARVLTTAKQAVVAEPQRPDELAHAKLALETARQPDAEIIDLRTRVIDLRNLRNEHVVKAR